MAIRAGMSLLEMIAQLTRGFVKSTGRQPGGLEKIKIKQEAIKRFEDMNKVVDLEGNVIDTSKGIMGGKQRGATLKSGIMKATGAGPKKVVIKGLPDQEFKDLRTSFRLGIAKNSSDFNQDLADKIIKREVYPDLSDAQRKDFLDSLDFVLKNPRDGSASGFNAADDVLVEQMYRTAGPRSLDEDKMYLAEFIAEDAGKVLDDLSIEEQTKFIERAKNALKRNVEQYRDKKAGGGRTGLSYLLAEDTNERMPFALGKIVKGGKWLIKSLRGTREQLKTMNMSPGQLKYYLDQIDDQIKSLEAGGKIPDEVIQTIRSDPKFKSVWQNQKSSDPDLREMEEVLLEYGQKHAEGGITRMPFKMGRRAFLKLMGGAGAAIGAAKAGLGSLFKAGKPVAKQLTSVPIKSGVDSMPSWFKPLVNKVIREGEEAKVTEYDRLITHTTKLPESKTPITVNQDLNTGDVWVDIGMGKHGFPDGYYGQPVRLAYKAAEVIEPDISKTGKVKSKGGETKEEFWVEEAEFTGGHPENVKFEESVAEKYGNHGSDFSEVERFATGKNVIKDKSGKFKEVETLPTTKKADQLEWARGRAEAEADAAADMADDFASGGLAKMLGE